jgi:hypothetical protein
VALADALGGQAARADGMRVEERLERLADDQRSELELLCLLSGVDHVRRAHAGPHPNRVV